MRRRDFFKATGVGLAAMAMGQARAWAAEGAAEKPNIIFILADDLGLGDVGCYGSDRYKTPNIDALAKGGVRFERCYSTPLCGPSRCQLLTGRYPFRTGLINNRSDNAIAPAREVMIPTVMKQAGYATAHAGKWGQMALGPGQWGFDEYILFPGSGVYTSQQSKSYEVTGKKRKLGDGEYMPDLMHNFVTDFIGRHRTNPFFMYYSMSHIHSPIVATPDSKPGGDMYAENIAYMDKLVGKLMDELDRLKLREKTVVFFSGDNGTWMPYARQSTIGGKPMHGAKASMFEGGSRVPLIASWPGTAPAGRVNADLIDFSDVLPTVAALGGADVPADRKIDGRSFAEQVSGRKGTPREWVYVELNGRSYVREDQWKLTNSGELYGMKDAPFAEALVAADSADAEAAAARKRLQAVLDQHPTAKGDPAEDKRPRAKAPRKMM